MPNEDKDSDVRENRAAHLEPPRLKLSVAVVAKWEPERPVAKSLWLLPSGSDQVGDDHARPTPGRAYGGRLADVQDGPWPTPPIPPAAPPRRRPLPPRLLLLHLLPPCLLVASGG